MSAEIVIDASGAILGRLCSYAAKQSLLGKSVVIINCSHALITGRRRFVIENYKEMRQRGGASLKGPFFPKQPQRIVKRTIRGMLPYTQGRGHDALKRVMCYDLLPKEYENSNKITLHHQLNTKAIALSDLSREL